MPAAIIGFAATEVAASVIGAEILGSTLLAKVAAGAAGAVAAGVFGSAIGAGKPESAPPSSSVDRVARGALINASSQVEPIPVVYGRRRVGGVRCLTEVSGESNEFLHIVLAVSEGPIARFRTVYLDDVPSDDARFAGLVSIEYYLGSETQEASAALIAALPDKWTTAHKGTGIAYLYVRLQYSQDAFGGLPTITCDIDGRTLYDPRDGQTKFSNNPILALRDYYTNTRYGRGIASASMDDTALQDEANHCDERVAVPAHTATFTADAGTDLLTFADTEIFATGDKVTASSTGTLPSGLSPATSYYVVRVTDTTIYLATSHANALAVSVINIGDAGTGVHTLTHVDQPRYTCDGIVNVDNTLVDNARALMTACRAWPVFSAGLYRIQCDKTETPTSFGFDEDNIVGAWQIALPNKRQLFNRVRAKYFNPVRRWQADISVQENSTFRTADNGLVLEDELDLPFTANEYGAGRIAQMHLNNSRFGIVVSFTATIAGLRAEVGDVVPITHSTPGWTDQPFRVTGIELLSGDEVRITARQYDADAYSLEDLDEAQIPPATNLPDPFTVGVPGFLTLTEELYTTTGSAGVKARLLVTWSEPADAFVDGYTLEYKLAADTDYKVISGLTAESTVIPDLAAGTYNLRVKARNFAGRYGDYATVTKEVVGLTAPPSDLTNFSLTPIGNQADLSWDKLTANSDLDVLIGGRILLRWSPLTSGATWNDGFEIGPPGGAQGDATSARVPHLTGTYMGRAQDSTGNQSTNKVSVITTAPDVIAYNAVATLTEDSTFTGTKSSTVVVDGKLQLDGAVLIDDMTDPIDSWGYIDSAGGVAATGTYDFSTYIDLGATYTSRVTATLKTLAFDTGDMIDARLDPIDSWGLIDGPEISDVDATLYVATTTDDPAGTPTWTSWRPFIVGDYKCRAFKFRLVLTSDNQNHNIQVEQLRVAVDMPDRTDGAREVTSGTGTYSVVYTLSPGLKALPKIGITAKNMATGDYYTITNEAVTGFDIAFKNAAGAGVSRTFDWLVRGY